MKKITFDSKKIERIREADVLVCGGGPAGVAAALASARTGAKTLLVEKYGFLGGMATAGLVNPLGPFDDLEKVIIRGIAWEIVERLRKIGGAEEKKNRWIGFDPEKLKLLLDEMMLESGVELIYHSLLIDSLVSDGSVEGVVCASMEGITGLGAKITVDATGNGDVSRFSGVPMHKGDERGSLQPPSLMFRLAGVKVGYNEVEINALMVAAKQDGCLKIPEFRPAAMASLGDGIVNMNFGHVFGVDTTTVAGLTKAEIEGRRLVNHLVDFLKAYVPQFRDARLIETGPQIGIRETYRITGDYVLTDEDVMETKTFADEICRNAYMVDVHLSSPEDYLRAGPEFTSKRLPPGASYGVPYRCLLPEGVDNLLVAGRCISTTRKANGSIRIMPCCMATGQAAGTAAALSIANGLPPRQLDPVLLRKELFSQNVYLP